MGAVFLQRSICISPARATGGNCANVDAGEPRGGSNGGYINLPQPESRGFGWGQSYVLGSRNGHIPGVWPVMYLISSAREGHMTEARPTKALAGIFVGDVEK